jgi:hypothetical protein
MFLMRNAVTGSADIGYPNTWLSTSQIMNCKTTEACDGTIFHGAGISIFCSFVNVTDCETSGPVSAFEIVGEWATCDVSEATFSAIAGNVAFSCGERQCSFRSANFFANQATTVLEFDININIAEATIELKACCFFSNTGTDLSVITGTASLEDCWFSKQPDTANLVGDPIVTDTQAVAREVLCATWAFLASSAHSSSLEFAGSEIAGSGGFHASDQVRATGGPGNSGLVDQSGGFANSGAGLASGGLVASNAIALTQIAPFTQPLAGSLAGVGSAAGLPSGEFSRSRVPPQSAAFSVSEEAQDSASFGSIRLPSASGEFTLPARLYQVRRRIRLGYLFCSSMWIF